MTEIFLVLSNLLFGISILVYFYFKEVKNQDRDYEKFQKITQFLVDAVNTLKINSNDSMKVVTELSKSKDTLFQKAFAEFLKHNEKLEKLILPQPVTRRAVQDILDQTPPMVPNDIEKIPEELEQDSLNEVLSKIPINKNTKVKFEDDMELPEEIETELVPDAMSGKLS